MKSIITSIAAGSLLATLAIAQTPRYTVTDLGTLGGTASVAFGINSAGRVAGAANVRGENQHAFLTGIGLTKFDFGTLGGPNSQGAGPNAMAELAVVSETSTPDPLKEDFCGFGNHLICLGALWDGAMTPLPTLGGNNAMAFVLNNRGQLAGVAENRTHDPSCPPPQILDFEPVIWGPAPGQVQGLTPLAGDTVGFALGINDLGQVVGSSGTCANTGVTALGLLYGRHAVLWDNGSVTDLGSLGGTMGKAGAINNRGDIAGFSGLPGDTSVHAFLWTQDTGMQDLGALGEDVLGDPAGINNSDQVVGGSCDNSGNCRAFFWQKKVMMDLNALIPADSPLYLIYALGINDAGEIVGFGLETSTGEGHAYVATPIRGPAATANSTATPVAASPMALPEHIRKQLQQRLRSGHFGGRLSAPK
jgi:probable HAF family extracellular repeat protein